MGGWGEGAGSEWQRGGNEVGDNRKPTPKRLGRKWWRVLHAGLQPPVPDAAAAHAHRGGALEHGCTQKRVRWAPEENFCNPEKRQSKNALEHGCTQKMGRWVQAACPEW